MLMVASGWLHISKLLGDRDIQSLQRWLKKMGESLPVITTERPEMNSHQERPGKGVMYQVDQKESPKHPDFKGFVVLEMDYKAGERVNVGLWQKQTRHGTTMFSMREDNWLKKKKLEAGQPTEVTPRYARKNTYNHNSDPDGDIPF